MCHAADLPESFGTGSFLLSSRDLRGFVTIVVTPTEAGPAVTFRCPPSLRRTGAEEPALNSLQGDEVGEVCNPCSHALG